MKNVADKKCCWYQIKEVDFTYFQDPAAFDVNIALLVLQLRPTNFSDVAREMSVIAPDNGKGIDALVLFLS